MVCLEVKSKMLSDRAKTSAEYCGKLARIFLLIFAGYMAGSYMNGGLFKKIEDVQSGFVAPADIHGPYSPDQDKNGLPETVMKIKDKDYLVKFDSNGEPIFQRFNIKPGRTINPELVEVKELTPEYIDSVEDIIDMPKMRVKQLEGKVGGTN